MADRDVNRVLRHLAGLYFTVVAGLPGVSGAIMAAGGTISHHHGVGTDHAPWLEREIGADGVRVLRAIKRELDPAGIMNPGTLLT